MKKNLFTAIAVAAFMVGAEVAYAADISFSGQFRPRYNYNEDATEGTNGTNNFTQRVRLNAKANVNANTEVFLQFQSIGTWGNAGDTAGSRVYSGGSDAVDDVGLHQAYVTLKNFMGNAVNAKVGRQEVVLDGHRLFGHTGWTDGAQTQDAIRLDHSAGNHTLNYIYIAGEENEAEATTTDANHNIHIFRANAQGVLGGDLTAMFVVNDDAATGGTDFDDENTWYTMGARQKGKLGGLDYRVEYYHQFGDGNVDAGAQAFSGAYATTPTDSSGHDRDAHMFGVRVGKTFANAKMSPTITLWFDSLSGTDDSDAAGDDMGTFNTQSDTGHKFYGFMDQFTNARNLGTAYYGLNDYAVKTKWKISPKNTFKMDFHHFETQTSMDDGDSDTLRDNHTGVASMDSTLGEELDLTLVHKYDANTKIVLGWSRYFTSVTHSILNGSGGTAGSNSTEDQDWMYVMVDTKF